MTSHPIPDDCDLGELVRSMAAPDTTNVVQIHDHDSVRSLTPEEALVQWILDLPDDAAVDRAAEYALRTIDGGRRNSPELAKLCDYLRQAKVAGGRALLLSKLHVGRIGLAGGMFDHRLGALNLAGIGIVGVAGVAVQLPAVVKRFADLVAETRMSGPVRSR